MPLYEREEGGRRMFYRIDLDGRHIRLQWGLFGGEGEHKTIAFDTGAEARAEYERHLAASTEADGYRQLDEGGGVAPVSLDNRAMELADASELERIVAEDPFDDDRWSVLEDWLQQQARDPRAELVRLTRALNPAAAAQEREARMALLLGRKHVSIGNSIFEPTWRGGYLVECTIASGRGVVGAYSAIAAAPAGRLLRELTFDLDNPRLVPGICAAIAEAPSSDALRRLAFKTGWRSHTASLDCTLLASLSLRSLDVGQSALQLEQVSSLFTLEELTAVVDNNEYLRRLLTGSLPALRSLAVNLKSPDRAHPEESAGRAKWLRNLIAGLTPIADATFAPNLEKLRFSARYAETARALHNALFELRKRLDLIVSDDDAT